MASVSHTQGAAIVRLLPELVEEILLRLPAESLVRFKLVCKSWRALINDPSFAKKHLRTSALVLAKKAASSASLILMWNHAKPPVHFGPPPFAQGICLIRIDDDGSSDHIVPCVVSEPKLPRFYRSKLARDDFHSMVVASTANGIICLSGVDKSPSTQIALCNPVLKRVKCFSQPVIDNRVYPCTVEGLEYDSRGDDYKLLRIYSAKDQREHRAFVYSLATASWKEIEIENYNISMFGSEAAYCGGLISGLLLLQYESPPTKKK